jgi:hypothetical protein
MAVATIDVISRDNLLSGGWRPPCLWLLDVMESQMQMSFGSQKERWSEVDSVHD